VEHEDIRTMGIELTATLAGKVDDIIARVLEELKVLGISPEKKI